MSSAAVLSGGAASDYVRTMLDQQPAASATVTEIALVDLSGIAHPIWHMSGGQPNPDYCSNEIVARVRKLTANHPKAAICCDKGKSFRVELNPEYKAQRPEPIAALHHQIKLAQERLESDGYPVWSVRGFEADDLIATAVCHALAIEDVSVLVISGDKDLLQLVGERVRVLSPGTGALMDAAAVRAKFGVSPFQIRDYLTLVGDAADNIKGAAGIGKVKAVELLTRYQTLEGVYQALTEHATQFKPAMATSLREFQPRMEQTRQLVTLRTDVEIPFAELDNDRAPVALEAEAMTVTDIIEGQVERSEFVNGPAPVPQSTSAPIPAPVVEPVKPAAEAKPANGNGNGHALAAPDALAAAPAEFERQLEPRSIGQAMQLAKAMHEARMFNGYGSAQAVLSTVLAGRELGMQAVASLRAFHIIEGKHALAADAMRGLVLRSGAAKYFRVIERTATRVEFETWRANDPEPVKLAYTIDEARTAFGFGDPGLDDKGRAALEGKWLRSGWGKHPADMLAARATSKLARLVYSDILFGLYSPEELND